MLPGKTTFLVACTTGLIAALYILFSSLHNALGNIAPF
jgi:hypothetical protein